MGRRKNSIEKGEDVLYLDSYGTSKFTNALVVYQAVTKNVSGIEKMTRSASLCFGNKGRLEMLTQLILKVEMAMFLGHFGGICAMPPCNQ
jgi:hypothetical protein